MILYEIFKKSKSESRLGVTWGWGLTVDGHEELYCGNENVLKLYRADACTSKFTKNHCIVQLK